MKIEIAVEPQSNDIKFIVQQVTSFNINYTGDGNCRDLAIFLRDENGHIVGGLTGETYWQWLHVDFLWVHESLRLEGYGYDLLATAEQEALKRGCHYSYLDTFSFQAPDFYQKCGYVIFGELSDFPQGNSRFFLKKKL